MIYTPYKDMRLSALGMGGVRFPSVAGDPNQIDRIAGQAIIDAAFAAGINCFDTAYTYNDGDSERFLGEALSRYPRSSYYLSTKFSVRNNPDLEEVFEGQLRRLKTDYIDFYMLHWLDEVTLPAYTDKDRDYIGFLLEQKKAGRIRYIGFSSHAAPDTLERFLDYYDGFDVAMIQLNYLDWTLLEAERQYELLTERRIPLWVMEPLKGGRLSTLSPESAAILKEAAPDRSLSSWGFRWLQGLDNVQVVFSGMATPGQVEENAGIFSVPEPLNKEEKAVLQRAAAIFMDSLGVPCSSCRYCCDSCPAELDIPLLIQGYNESKVSGDPWRLGRLSEAKGSGECLQCGACLPHCPQKINIPDIMDQLAVSSE